MSESLVSQIKIGMYLIKFKHMPIFVLGGICDNMIKSNSISSQ